MGVTIVFWLMIEKLKLAKLIIVVNWRRKDVTFKFLLPLSLLPLSKKSWSCFYSNVVWSPVKFVCFMLNSLD